jgi:hypothetical protein
MAVMNSVTYNASVFVKASKKVTDNNKGPSLIDILEIKCS